MKILLTSIGTRGDMEPFLAIGEQLGRSGHEIICAFPEQFKPLAESSGFSFFTLGPEFMQMLESETGKLALGSSKSSLRKFWAYIQLAFLQRSINQGIITKTRAIVEAEQPDYIIHNGKATYPVIWETWNPGRTVFVSPVPYLHYVKGNTHLAFNSNWGDWLNKFTYWLADWGLLNTIKGAAKSLELTDVSKNAISHALQTHKVMYAISPSLFTPPKYWPSNIQVLGYHERNKQVDWEPSNQLLNFLNRHEKVLFITFGSMTNPDPEGKTRILVDILNRHHIPAIINTAEGGLKEYDAFKSDHIHFVSQIPYDWLLPKVYAVMHHGGSGTTHSCLKYGCASMIIPHIIDQFVWNKIIAKKGLGPLGVQIGKFNTQTIEYKLLDLYTNATYKKNAEQMGKKMNAEGHEEEVSAFIFSELDSLK